MRDLSNVCSQIVLICLHLARIGRSDILWSWNNLARAVINWSGACDWRSVRLNSYIGIDSKTRTWPGTSKSQNRHREEILCIFGSRTFVHTSWMCQKQTSVSHSSAESSQIIVFTCRVARGWFSPLSISGIWSLKYHTLHWTNLEHGGTCVAMSSLKKVPTLKRRNTPTRKILGYRCRSRYQKRKTFSLVRGDTQW